MTPSKLMVRCVLNDEQLYTCIREAGRKARNCNLFCYVYYCVKLRRTSEQASRSKKKVARKEWQHHASRKIASFGVERPKNVPKEAKRLPNEAKNESKSTFSGARSVDLCL